MSETVAVALLSMQGAARAIRDLTAERDRLREERDSLAEQLDSCENGHKSHADCTEACNCVGSGKSRIEVAEAKAEHAQERLDAVHGLLTGQPGADPPPQDAAWSPALDAARAVVADRDQARHELGQWREQAWRAESQLSIRVGMRRELEALLGLGDTTGEEQFRAGLDRIKAALARAEHAEASLEEERAAHERISGALADRAERLAGALREALERITSVPARPAGTARIHSPQIGVKEVARWHAALEEGE